jgi:predicted kinase
VHKYSFLDHNTLTQMLNIQSPFLSLLIVLFCGLPGVGKTRLANELAPLINAIVLSTDKIRKELIPKPTYTKDEKDLIYDVILLVARYLHNAAGVNCILDATFNTEESREKAKRKLASVSPDQIYIVECSCPEDIVISRLKARKGDDYSDADVGIYRKMKQIYEPVKDKQRHIVANTSRDPKVNAEEIKSRIFEEKQRNE